MIFKFGQSPKNTTTNSETLRREDFVEEWLAFVNSKFVNQKSLIVDFQIRTESEKHHNKVRDFAERRFVTEWLGFCKFKIR